MYEILANISRYIFLIYIILFLLLGFFICLNERNLVYINRKAYLLCQRLIIFFFHTSAFIILAFDKNTNNLNLSVVPFFLSSLCFIVFGNFFEFGEP